MRNILLAVLWALGVGVTQAQDSAHEAARLKSIESRGVEAVIWGMPAVNFERMYQALRDAGGNANQIVLWSRIPNWKNQTLTPNPSTIYLMPFVDMSQVGPVVLEIPPAKGGEITGTIMNAWQNALEDVGPAGIDGGKGGKYLLVPPSFEGKLPRGHIVLRSDTNMAYALLRSNVRSGNQADVDQAVAYARKVKLYPLSGKEAATVFVDAADIVFDSTIPYGIEYFKALDRFMQRELWLERDKAMIDQLKAVGLERGKPFDPAPDVRDVLQKAALEARTLLELRYQALFKPAFYENSQWALPVPHDLSEGLANSFSTPGVYPVDSRGTFYSFAFSSVKHLGTGQFYLVTIRDSDGNLLNGGATYKLTVPADAPVSLYWSGTVYDRATHALIRDQVRSSRGSNTPELKTKPDGSVDLFFSPEPPAGRETNWIPTRPDGGWEIIFRFYGPTKPLFDKSWRLPDIEKVAE